VINASGILSSNSLPQHLRTKNEDKYERLVADFLLSNLSDKKFFNNMQ
jgi:hypothetical protein